MKILLFISDSLFKIIFTYSIKRKVYHGKTCKTVSTEKRWQRQTDASPEKWAEGKIKFSM
jgi:hypothetical protein